jgi:hypothetical protein
MNIRHQKEIQSKVKNDKNSCFLLHFWEIQILCVKILKKDMILQVFGNIGNKVQVIKMKFHGALVKTPQMRMGLLSELLLT